MPTKIFVTLPVKNLDTSVAFFTRLGSSLDAHCTDETTCLVVSDDIFARLLTQDKFKT